MAVADELRGVIEMKKRGDLDNAVIAVEGVLARFPTHPIAFAHLADVQVKRSRLEEAASAIEKAESEGGATFFTARVRGDLAMKQEKFREAAAAYSDAEALGEKGTWSLVQLAKCLLRLKDLEGAKGAASRAIERDPASSYAWVVLGDIATKEGDLDRAEEMYRRAHEQAPNDTFAYASLVRARLNRLDPDDREPELQVLIKTADPRHKKQLQGVLAKLRAESGDASSAADTWGKAATDHGDAYSRRMQGFSLKKAGRLDEAAQVLGRCLIEEPTNVVVFRSYVSLQRSREALAELKQVLEEALPRAGARRGAFYGELKKLPADAATPDLPLAQNGPDASSDP